MNARSTLTMALLCAAFFAAGCGPKPPVVTVKPTTAAGTPVAVPGSGQTSPPSPEAATIKFTEVTASAGIDFTYKNDNQKMNRAIVESVGGGQGMFDFDRDGLLDLLYVGGGLYRGPENKE